MSKHRTGPTIRDKVSRRLGHLTTTTCFRLVHGPHLALGRRVRFERSVTLVPHPAGFLTLELEDGVRIGQFTRIQGAGLLRMGERSYCSPFCLFGVGELVDIGRDVMIGERASIRDTNHAFEDPNTPMIDQGTTTDPVRIEDNVWVGAGVQILPGVTVGSGAVLAAGAIVTKDVAPNSIVGGIPARVIGTRGDAPT